MRISWLIGETQHRMDVPDCELVVKELGSRRLLWPNRGPNWMLALPQEARLWIEYEDNSAASEGCVIEGCGCAAASKSQ